MLTGVEWKGIFAIGAGTLFVIGLVIGIVRGWMKKRLLFISFICAVMLHLCLLLPFKIGSHIPPAFKHRGAVEVQLLKREDFPKILMPEKKKVDKKKIKAESEDWEEELSRRVEEIGKEVKELSKKIEETSKKWDEKSKEQDERLKELGEESKKISKRLDQTILMMEAILVVILGLLSISIILSTIRNFIRKREK